MREALSEYVAKHRHARITERLSEVYATGSGDADSFVSEAARRTLRKNEWR